MNRFQAGTLGAALLAATLTVPAAAGGQTVDPLSRLQWMTGSWYGEADGVATEEHWTAPRGGVMLGMHRDIKAGTAVAFEFARIEAVDGRLVYQASPGGAPPTPFTAVQIDAQRVVFENAAHDFPQRVIYWREGSALVARIEGTQRGRQRSAEWKWQPGTLQGPGR